jgi:hypothetical protein
MLRQAAGLIVLLISEGYTRRKTWKQNKPFSGDKKAIG